MATIEDSNLAVIIEMLDFIIKKISSFEELFNKSDKSNKTWITLQEASKRVSLSKPTLLKLINNGDITAKKLDGKWLINKEYGMKISMNLHQKLTGVYYVIYRDPKGKQRWKSLGTKNKGEATRLYNQFKRAYLQGKLRKLEDNLSNITLQKFVDEFLNHIETTKENNTFDTYLFICKEIIFFFDKGTLLKNINTKDIDSYIEYCKRVRKNKNITINKKLKH